MAIPADELNMHARTRAQLGAAYDAAMRDDNRL
jgi:hypothetical protein